MKSNYKPILYSIGGIVVLTCTLLFYSYGKDDKTKEVHSNQIELSQISDDTINSTTNIIITSLSVPEKICEEYNKTWISSNSPSDDIANRKAALISANMFSLMKESSDDLDITINNIEKPSDIDALKKYDAMMDLYNIYKEFVQLANSTDGSGDYAVFNKKRTDLILQYNEVEQQIK